MPHFKSAFPSKFLNASEIETPYDAVIASILFENVGTDDKPERKLVATFEGGRKAIVLNQSRCEALAELTGTPDYERWPGTTVNVSRGSTRFNGQRVACIVLGPPAITEKSKKGKPARGVKPATDDAEEVPF